MRLNDAEPIFVYGTLMSALVLEGLLRRIPISQPG